MVHSAELIYDADTCRCVREDLGRSARQRNSQPIARQPAAYHRGGGRTHNRPRHSALYRSIAFLLPRRLGATLLFGRSAAVLACQVLTADCCAPPRRLPACSASSRHRNRCRTPVADQWTPHVTLACHIAPARLATAQRIAGRPDEIVGSIVGLRR